jgi:hypothetical protein
MKMCLSVWYYPAAIGRGETGRIFCGVQTEAEEKIYDVKIISVSTNDNPSVTV